MAQHDTPEHLLVKAETRIKRLEDAMRLAADIIDRNWSHQREKLPDASAILRKALK